MAPPNGSGQSIFGNLQFDYDLLRGRSLNMSASGGQSDSDVVRQFTLWALAELGFEVQRDNGVYQLDVPDDKLAIWPASPHLRLQFESEAEPHGESEATDLVRADSEFLRHVATALGRSAVVLHARPASQPESIYQITERLFSRYTLDGGHVRLSGCSLEEIPMFRLTYLCTSSEKATVPLRHVFVDQQGEPVEPEQIESLGMDEIAPCGPRRPRFDESRVPAILTSAKPAIRSLLGEQADLQEDLLAVTVVWVRWVVGKLEFEFGDRSAELPFEGWARTIEAPPYECPITGDASYEVAATDEGEVTTMAQLGECAASGGRYLRSKLVECAVTGQLIHPDHAAFCPVLSSSVLPSEMATCAMCRQSVARNVIENERCRACRSLTAVAKDDPRMARLLGEYPHLDRWRSWKLSETDDCYILVAASLFRRLLVVADKNSLELRHVATRARFLSQWAPLDEAERHELLR